MITRLALSSIKQGLPKYRSALAGNDTYIPGVYDSIATTTVGSGGASTIDFTSISSSYTHLQIRMLVRTNQSSTGDTIWIRCNSDTSSNYTAHILYGDGASVGSQANYTNDRMYLQYYGIAGDTATSNVFGVCVLDLLDYKNTNKYKTIRMLSGADRNGAGDVEFASGLWMSTNAVSSITISPRYGTNFKQYSRFALYGIKVTA